jgi:hypothetical protein
MSTRATYQFTDSKNNFTPTITYYVHYDGYPEGAAAYFWAAHHHANERGGMCDKFIRANENAEHTRDHEAHGDTEYVYTMDGDQLTAAKVIENDENGLVTETFFTGHYCEFINQHGEQLCENFEKLKEVKLSQYGYKRWLTRTQLAELLKQAEEKLANYLERGGKVTDGNGRSHQDEVDTLTYSLKYFDGERGIIIDVFQNANGSDCTNNGASSRHKRFVLVHPDLDGVFAVSENLPAIRIVEHYSVKNVFYLKPDETVTTSHMPMFGGNFAWCCDSRVRALMPSPLPIHDRVE